MRWPRRDLQRDDCIWESTTFALTRELTAQQQWTKRGLQLTETAAAPPFWKANTGLMVLPNWGSNQGWRNNFGHKILLCCSNTRQQRLTEYSDLVTDPSQSDKIRATQENTYRQFSPTRRRGRRLCWWRAKSATAIATSHASLWWQWGSWRHQTVPVTPALAASSVAILSASQDTLHKLSHHKTMKIIMP